MDIAHRKLNLIDAVLVGTQDLKVKEALKTRNTAMERVDILERTIARDEQRYKLKREHSEERLEGLESQSSEDASIARPARAWWCRGATTGACASPRAAKSTTAWKCWTIP